MQLNRAFLGYRRSVCVLLDLTFVLFLASFIVCCKYDSNATLLFYLLYATCFNMLFYLMVSGLKRNIAMFLFTVSFYTFLMGSKLFINPAEKNVFTLFVTVQLNGNDYLLFLALVFFSLTTTYIAYRATKSLKSKGPIRIQTHNVDLRKNYTLKLAIKALMPMFLVACIVEAFISWHYVKSVGYVASYVETVPIPTIISRPASLFPFLVIMMFALEPTREEVKLTTKYYLISLVCTVFSGRRTDLVIGLMFIIWYLSAVDNQDRFSKKFLTMRRLVILAGFSFVFIGFLGAYSFIRAGSQGNSTNVLQYITYFFQEIGRSDTVIADAILYKDFLPKSGFNYFIYPIKDLISGNIITKDIYQAITGLKSATSVGQGLVKLRYTDNFADWLTYLVSPKMYISGHGLGSSYIAETFIAFGFTGVIAYSTILGYVLNALTRFNLEKVGSKVLAMVVFQSILFASRGPAIGFIDSLYELLVTFITVKIVSFIVSFIVPYRKGAYGSEYPKQTY